MIFMPYFQNIIRIDRFRRVFFGALALLLTTVWCASASAITIKEEEELSKEFFKVIRQQVELIDDPLVNEYVNRVGRKILAGIGPQPFEFKFYVIKEDVYNAFAIPAGHIFINSGLLMAMNREDELAGILSHEISHVVCRHISQRIERSKKIDLATLAGVVAGLFLGAASGNPAITQSMVFGSAAAGQTAHLGYSREDEMQADQLGLDYLDKAGYSAGGLQDVLQKIRSRQWFGTDVVPSYLMTHPAVEQRIVDIDAWVTNHPRENPQAQDKTQEQTPVSFRRMVLRLKALYGDIKKEEQFFRSTVLTDAKSNAPAAVPNGIPKGIIDSADVDLAYGHALLLSRLGRRDEAETRLREALARKAMDPLLLTELGRVYFMDGRYQDALGILSGVAALPADNSEAKYYLGRTYLMLDQNQAAAMQFEDLIKNTRTYRDAYYYLGEAHSKSGSEANAHYYLGLFYYHKGDDKLSFHHLTKARQIMQDANKLESIKSILEEIRPKPGEEK